MSLDIENMGPKALKRGIFYFDVYVYYYKRPRYEVSAID